MKNIKQLVKSRVHPTLISQQLTQYNAMMAFILWKSKIVFCLTLTGTFSGAEVLFFTKKFPYKVFKKYFFNIKLGRAFVNQTAVPDLQFILRSVRHTARRRPQTDFMLRLNRFV